MGRHFFRNTNYVANMSNIFISIAIRWLALYSGGGRPQNSGYIDFVVIKQRSTKGAVECATASVLIIGEGSKKHPPTTFAFCPNTAAITASVQLEAQVGSDGSYGFSYTTGRCTHHARKKQFEADVCKYEITTNVSIHRLCQYYAFFQSDNGLRFIRFKIKCLR